MFSNSTSAITYENDSAEEDIALIMNNTFGTLVKQIGCWQEEC